MDESTAQTSIECHKLCPGRDQEMPMCLWDITLAGWHPYWLQACPLHPWALCCWSWGFPCAVIHISCTPQLPPHLLNCCPLPRWLPNEFCSFWHYGDLTVVSSSAERGSPSSSHSSFTFLIAHGTNNQQLLPGNHIFDEPGLRAPTNSMVLVGEPQLLLLAGGDLFLVPSVAHHPVPGFSCSAPGLHCQCLMKHHFSRSCCLYSNHGSCFFILLLIYLLFHLGASVALQIFTAVVNIKPPQSSKGPRMPLTICLQTLESHVSGIFWQNLCFHWVTIVRMAPCGRQMFYKWQGSCVRLVTRFRSIYNFIFQMAMRKNCLMTPFPGVVSIMVMLFSCSSSSICQHMEIFSLR